MFLLHASDEVVLRLTLPSLSYGFYNHNNNINDKDDDESEDEFDDDFDAGNNVKKRLTALDSSILLNLQQAAIQ